MPPVVEAVQHRLRVVLGGLVIADTEGGKRVLEMGHAPTYYFPKDDVCQGVLSPGLEGEATCQYRGRTVFHDVTADGLVSHKAAWSYPEPAKAFGAIAGFIAFFPERVEACLIGNILAWQVPGSFYGGWATPNLVGFPENPHSLAR